MPRDRAGGELSFFLTVYWLLSSLGPGTEFHSMSDKCSPILSMCPETDPESYVNGTERCVFALPEPPFTFSLCEDGLCFLSWLQQLLSETL